MCKFLPGHMFPFLLGNIQKWNCWVIMVNFCLTFSEIAQLVSKVAYPFTVPPAMHGRSSLSTFPGTLFGPDCHVLWHEAQSEQSFN